ncbi:MAG: PhoU domain-containing protein [Bacteroidota bacterium]|nr:PhoU domain-containing protein [Bacteroidota bacterium]
MLKFKELYELWRRDNFLKQAWEESYLMLETTREMFDKSVYSLRSTENAEIGGDVYNMDKSVNTYLQDVRRKVFKHLAVTGGANIIPGLVLTSIVIDVERIGDYTKNIVDIAIAHPGRLFCGKHEQQVKKIEESVTEMFKKILPCLRSSDKEMGHLIMSSNEWITKECDKIVIDLIQHPDETIPVEDSVTTALYCRYIKRVAAHLLNVASSVVNPFDRVGFREES